MPLMPFRWTDNYKSGWIVALILLLLFLTGTDKVHAQSFWRKNDRNTYVRNIQMNFNIPSARAVALGGAFVAVADDATAGMANPAGLTIITIPEISAHFKYSRFTHEEYAGTADNPNARKVFKDEVGSQSYLSLVYPYGNWSFSLFRQELINFESSFSAEGFGSVFESPNLDPGDFEPGNNSHSDIEVNNWGFAAAFQATKKLSIGISANVSSLEFIFNEELYQRLSQGRPERFFSVKSNSRDTKKSLNLGIKYSPYDFLSFGAVYRSGPSFNIRTTLEDVDVNSSSPSLFNADQFLKFKVPDVYSLGTSCRLSNNLMLSFDVVRVEYSDLVKGLDRNLVEDDVPVARDEFPYSGWVDGDNVHDLVVEDATEYHFGVEYLILFNELLIPIRAGIYNDPAHVVYTTVENESLKRLFPEGKNYLHGTLGFGFVIRDEIQIDLAANYSKNLTELLLSAVFRF